VNGKGNRLLRAYFGNTKKGKDATQQRGPRESDLGSSRRPERTTIGPERDETRDSRGRRGSLCQREKGEGKKKNESSPRESDRPIPATISADQERKRTNRKKQKKKEGGKLGGRAFAS